MIYKSYSKKGSGVMVLTVRKFITESLLFQYKQVAIFKSNVSSNKIAVNSHF